MDSDTTTATDETLQPWQSAETAAGNDTHPRQIGIAEQILAPRESVRAAAMAKVAVADPKIRLALRNHPVVRAVIISDVMTRAIAVAKIISFHFWGYSSAVSHSTDAVDVSRALDLARASVVDLTRDLARARDLDLDLARNLDLDLARTLDLARDLAPDLDLDRDLDFARDFNFARDFARARTLDFARDLARALALDSALDSALDRDLDRALDRARARARDLARALDSALDRARDRALDRAGARARDLARALDSALDRALDSALDRARARHLDRALDSALDRALDRALDLARILARELVPVLGRQFGLQNIEELASAFLAGALDDFSRADLSGIDLTSVDLLGVRWSEWDTRWPPGTDIERLRSASEETEPGSGVFVITRPRGTDRTSEEVRV